jgi:hypothetical protein
LVSRVWDISSGIGICFPLAGGLCKLYANALRKTTNTAQTTLSAIQAASQSTFITSLLTPLVISGNDKNRQLTLLSICKLAFTGRNILMAL